MIGRVGGRGYRDLEVRKTAETDEEGAAEARRKIGTVGPDDEVTATGVDTIGQEASETSILVVQGNLANTYERMGRLDEAMRLREDVYSGYLKLLGEEHEKTLVSASNYAISLIDLQRFEEANTLFLKLLPVARRVLGNSNGTTLRMGTLYAQALYKVDGATLDDLREAVETLEDTERIARRVLGGANPITSAIEEKLRDARAALNAELRAAFKEDPSSLSADDRARAEQLLARDARKAAKKAARASESA